LNGNNATITNAVAAATGSFTGNVLAGNLNSNAAVTGVTITATGNLVGNNATITNAVTAATGSFTGNVLAGNVNSNAAVTGVTITASGNLVGGNANITNAVTAATGAFTGNVTTGNVSGTTVSGTTGSFSGNVLAGNLNSNAAVTGVTITATGNITGGNISTSGKANLGNIRISANDITSVDTSLTVNSALANVSVKFSGTAANLLVLDAPTNTVNIGTGTAVTGAKLQIASTDSMLVPVGNTTQRPTGVTGMVRFNTALNQLELYNNTTWVGAGSVFTVVTADEFVGNGVQTNFTLTANSTTAASIVSINGVVQIPTTAYSVTGNVLAFTEAPAASDYVDARSLTTTTTVTGITNAPGTAVISVTDTTANVSITGNILPTANAVANIGSATLQFNTIFAKATSAQYADLAEMYEADQFISSGTVVCFGGGKEITVCTKDGSRRVAGVISTNPSYIMNAGLLGDCVVAVALTGRVPCRVTGTVHKGDMMVATGDGRARAEENPATGSVIGKALADFDGADGVIEVVVGRL